MKKAFILLTLFAIGTLFSGISTVMAGGDPSQGAIGIGYKNKDSESDDPLIESPDTLAIQSADNASVLDDEEIYHLKFIREEEKMARDVYRVLLGTWGNSIFANITESEQNHMDAVANLLAFYKIDDPVMSDETGAFTDELIGQIYSDLVERGSTSEIDALLVGAYIEEYDILDIWYAYDHTDEDRIKKVYQNLYEGSYNHLDAFVHVYESVAGATYEPDLLSDEEYDYVMSFETQANQSQGSKN